MLTASWEEFSKSAEKLYLNDPMKCRFVTKYRHCDGKLEIKITDDRVVLQYRTEHTQDVKKLEKLTSHLMRHMASKEKWSLVWVPWCGMELVGGARKGGFVHLAVIFFIYNLYFILIEFHDIWHKWTCFVII